MVNGIDVSHQYVLNLIWLLFFFISFFHFRSKAERELNEEFIQIEYSFRNGMSLIEHKHLIQFY